MASSKGQATMWAKSYCPPILFLVQIFSVCKKYFCSFVHKDKWDIPKGTRKELPLSSESQRIHHSFQDKLVRIVCPTLLKPTCFAIKLATWESTADTENSQGVSTRGQVSVQFLAVRKYIPTSGQLFWNMPSSPGLVTEAALFCRLTRSANFCCTPCR